MVDSERAAPAICMQSDISADRISYTNQAVTLLDAITTLPLA